MTTAVSTRPRLTADQLSFFHREGYLKYDQPVFSEDEFTSLKRYFEDKLDRLPEGVRPETMDVPHFTDTGLFHWLFHPSVLDLVEPVLGPDIALFSSHFICKPKGNGKRVPWHEDSYYWRGQMEPMEVCTVWLAIDPSTMQNGCMKVIPRTQSGGYSDYEDVDPEKNVFNTEIKKHQFDASKAVALELQPNQASLHDGKLMHGSDPNTSSIRRCGYTMRYISTRTRFDHEKLGQWHHLYLARGKDHAGNVYGDPAKSYDHLARYRETHKKGGH
jgi:hypothetical protein